MSVPFLDQRFLASMADGRKLELVAAGNYLGAAFRTLDGHPVQRDPQSGLFFQAAGSACGPTALPRSVRRAITAIEAATFAPTGPSLVSFGPALTGGSADALPSLLVQPPMATVGGLSTENR